MLEMIDRQNGRFARPSYSLSSSLTLMCTSSKLFHRNTSEMNKFSNEAFQKLNALLVHYQTVIDQRLTIFHQLFSWTLVRLSKCPIDKIIGLQGLLTV